MAGVRCHMSCVRCQVSGVRGNIVVIIFFLQSGGALLGGGFVINGAYPLQFDLL